jgi:hypothetical protein
MGHVECGFEFEGYSRELPGPEGADSGKETEWIGPVRCEKCAGWGVKAGQTLKGTHGKPGGTDWFLQRHEKPLENGDIIMVEERELRVHEFLTHFPDGKMAAISPELLNVE